MRNKHNNIYTPKSGVYEQSFIHIGLYAKKRNVTTKILLAYKKPKGNAFAQAYTFAKSHEPTHNLNFAKEPHLANLSAEQAGAPMKSILVMTNWNSYDR